MFVTFARLNAFAAGIPAAAIPFSEMEYLSVRPTRRRIVPLLVISLAFVASGIFILIQGGPALVGWMAIVFFGAGAAVFVLQLVEARPRLVLSDEGVFDRTLGVGTIAWDEIEGAYVRSIRGHSFICLLLRDPAKYESRLNGVRRAMASANQSLGFTEFSVNLSGLGVDPGAVLELILKKAEEVRAGLSGRR